MKKRLAIVTVICALLLLLTSCVKETTTVDIHKDGGTVTQDMVITKEVYDYLMSLSSEEEKAELTDEQTDISFFTEDGVEYVKISETQQFDSLSELSDYVSNLGVSEDDDSDDSAYFESLFINLTNSGSCIEVHGNVGIISDTTGYTSCDVIFQFPGKVTYSNIGEIVDETTVKIDMLDAWENQAGRPFVIEANASNVLATLRVILIVVAVIVILAILLVLLTLLALVPIVLIIVIIVLILVIVKKKRNKNKASKNDDSV